MLPPKKENRRTFRLTDEEYESLRQQAEKLGTDRAGYIKLIIALDVASGIINRLQVKSCKTCNHEHNGECDIPMKKCRCDDELELYDWEPR